MIVALASDHNGVALKSALKDRLIEIGYSCVDLGPFDNKTVDYVTYARQLGEVVSRGDAAQGNPDLWNRRWHVHGRQQGSRCPRRARPQ